MKVSREKRNTHARQERVGRKPRRRRENRRLIVDEKRRRGCELCGRKDLPLPELHFHHRDPHHKNRPVCALVSSSNARVVEEMKKCRLWCASAHAHYHRTGEVRLCHDAMTRPAASERTIA